MLSQCHNAQGGFVNTILPRNSYGFLFLFFLAPCTQNSLSTIPYTIHHHVLTTRQTLLSVSLANHAVIETCFQDEDSQMDQSKLEDPLVNARPEV